MFKRILVPLDGSARAEQALPLAIHIAQTYHSAIVLVRVIDIISAVGVSSIQVAALMSQMRSRQEQEATEYLMHLSSSEVFAHVETSIEVHTGDVSSCLLGVIHNRAADLLIMTSHGYTGYKRWMLGSVAQKIARESPVPVLIQREQHPFSFTPSMEKEKDLSVCVALNGTPLGEVTIIPALYIVAACAAPQHGEVHLLRIVKELDRDETDTFQKLHQINIQRLIYDEASKYLQDLSARCNKDIGAQLGVSITWSAHIGRDIAQSIIQTVESESPEQPPRPPYAMLALATHGRKGLPYWALGSVAERVLNHTKLPLLVVHPQKQTNNVQ
jgi:Universal stress protein UspA and related nucleotide-binding proteins